MTAGLLAQQRTLSLLSEQLSSGNKFNSITEYSPPDAKRILSLNAALTQRNAYLFSIDTAINTMAFYEVSLNQIESSLGLAINFASNSNLYSQAAADILNAQATSYLDSMTAILNQTINGKFVYSGARFTTAPVADLSTLPTLPVPPPILTTPTTPPDLPSYDSEYVAGIPQNAFAFVTATATIDENYVLDYGITSNDPPFQKMILGLRYMQAAGKATNSADYRAYLDAAAPLMREALSEIESLHTFVVGNNYLVNNQKVSQESIMLNLTNQLATLKQVDRTEVGVRITEMTSLIQASYSVTGSLLKLSILNYL